MEENMREMSLEELGAVCSNLAKTCEKQMRVEEAELFSRLSSYYEGLSCQRARKHKGASFKELSDLVEKDLSQGYAEAKKAIGNEHDRGALRALVWGEKASKLLKSLLTRYERQGNALLENTSVYVCDICGFVYVGDLPPEICPVCKVPSLKILPVRKEAV